MSIMSSLLSISENFITNYFEWLLPFYDYTKATLNPDMFLKTVAYLGNKHLFLNIRAE